MLLTPPPVSLPSSLVFLGEQTNLSCTGTDQGLLPGLHLHSTHTVCTETRPKHMVPKDGAGWAVWESADLGGPGRHHGAAPSTSGTLPCASKVGGYQALPLPWTLQTHGSSPRRDSSATQSTIKCRVPSLDLRDCDDGPEDHTPKGGSPVPAVHTPHG